MAKIQRLNVIVVHCSVVLLNGFAEQKADEELEFVRSGNMPAWAVDAPATFWHSADRYEIARGRTSSTLTVALPKELSKQQRKELVEAFIQEFADQYQFAEHSFEQHVIDASQVDVNAMIERIASGESSFEEEDAVLMMKWRAMKALLDKDS